MDITVKAVGAALRRSKMRFTASFEDASGNRNVQKWETNGLDDKMERDFFLASVKRNEKGGETKTFIGADTEKLEEN